MIIIGGTLYEELIEKTIGECEDPCIIGVDKGVEFLYRHRIQPSYIVGDFDSLSQEIVDY